MATPKILLLALEDDPRHAKVLMLTVRRNLPQVELILVSNGQECLDKIAGMDRRPDVCILDINTPVKNGFDVLKTLRMQARYDRMSICMLTTSPSEYDKAKAMELGADGYYVKPPIKKMPKTLEELLDAALKKNEEPDQPDTWSRIKHDLEGI